MNSIVAIRQVALFAASLMLVNGCGAVSPEASSLVVERSMIGAQVPYGHISPSASKRDLLYVSATDKVLVLSYPSGKRVGQLTGFSNYGLTGLCSDSAGNVFVVDATSTSQSYIYEYAHGGSQPIATLSDPGFGDGCAVDSGSGNLAVANYGGATGSRHPGDIAVYQNAQGQPAVYTDTTFGAFFFCSYDSNGNLFADGNGGVVELPNGGNEMEKINLSKAINPFSLQWHQKRLVIIQGAIGRGGQSVYQVQVRGNSGTVTGPITLVTRYDRRPGLVQFWNQGDMIIGPDQHHGPTLLSFWNYPKGGEPIRSINLHNTLFGVTVSVAPGDVKWKTGWGRPVR